MTPQVRSWQPFPPEDERDEHTVVGSVRLLRGVRSPQLGNRRDLYVCLPPGYARTRRRYPVLYMHDGQNLFDQATSFADEWRVDETVQALGAAGLPMLVVGIANTGETRCDEYSPFVDDQHGGGCGDAYLEFLIDSVKPRIDADFRTLPGREHTGVLGSSMGGLISLYALFEHPEVFGFAGVMSPALWFAGGAIFPWVERAPHAPSRVYLDVGTREGRRTVVHARRMRRILHRKGYDAGHDLRYVEQKDAGHTESAWAERLPAALRWWLEG